MGRAFIFCITLISLSVNLGIFFSVNRQLANLETELRTNELRLRQIQSQLSTQDNLPPLAKRQ
jgi:hypothetical protein